MAAQVRLGGRALLSDKRSRYMQNTAPTQPTLLPSLMSGPPSDLSNNIYLGKYPAGSIVSPLPTGTKPHRAGFLRCCDPFTPHVSSAHCFGTHSLRPAARAELLSRDIWAGSSPPKPSAPSFPAPALSAILPFPVRAARPQKVGNKMMYVRLTRLLWPFLSLIRT